MGDGADEVASAGAAIRPETPEDRQAIAEVVTAAFGSPAQAWLVGALRDFPGSLAGLSLVAVLEGRIVGHVMISRAELRDRGTRHPVGNLSPLAVHPDARRRGIGSALVRQVVARADAAGEPAVVLEGDPRFYGRLGFEHALRYGIEITLPAWAAPEAAQVQILRGYDPSIRGRVHYPPAFAALSQHQR